MSDAQVTRLPSSIAMGEPAPEVEVELGVSVTMPFGSYYESEAELFNNGDITSRQLIEMRKRDAHVRALLRLVTLPIRSCSRRKSIVPADGGEAEAEFIDKVFSLPGAAGGMTTPLETWMAQVLLGLCDSTACFEIVYRVPDKGDLANKITIRKIARRPIDTIHSFLVDRNGGFAGFRQVTSAFGRAVNVMIRPPYAWYYAANEEENPFWGVSYFLPAFYHAENKKKLYYVTHLAAQFRAVPGRVATVPTGYPNTKKLALKRALEDFGLAQAMIKEAGVDVEEFGKTLGQFNFVELLEHHNREMSKSVLMQMIDEKNKPALVDSADPEDDMMVMSMESVMSDIEARINNHIIPNLIDWNFATGLYPQFKFAPLSDDQKRVISATFEKLSVAGTIQVSPQFMLELEKYMAEVMGLEIDYEAVEAEQEKMRQAEADAQLATHAATQATSEFTAKNPEPPKPDKPALSGPPILDFSDLMRQAVADAGDG